MHAYQIGEWQLYSSEALTEDERDVRLMRLVHHIRKHESLHILELADEPSDQDGLVEISEVG